MFSKEESAQLRKEFWTSYGKSFPRKWILYNTKIKGFAFKFGADRKTALVGLDFEHPNKTTNQLLFEQLLALKKLLEQELPEVIFDANFRLPNGKVIHRVYIPFNQKFSIHNKATWRTCFEFFNETMTKFEVFYLEYEDFIKKVL